MLILWTWTAHAADPVAESLFEEAVNLMKSGDFDAACPKLAASHKREPLSGTLITLAQCHEKQGKTATAWTEFKGAAALATTESREAYVEAANKAIAALEPKLSKLRINVAAQPGLAVEHNGTPVDTATFGVAVAVDPGEHKVSATRPDHEPWSRTVTITAPGVELVEVPLLQAPPPSDPDPLDVVAPAPDPEPKPDTTTDDGGAPIWPWIVGGVGVASLVVSVVFLADQLSAASALDEMCGEARDDCPPAAEFDATADFDRESRSSALFITFGAIGVAAIGVAIVGIVVGGSDEPSQAWNVDVAPLNGGAAVGFSHRF